MVSISTNKDQLSSELLNVIVMMMMLLLNNSRLRPCLKIFILTSVASQNKYFQTIPN